nr:MAG TPA: hypothetical protein [Caudoviricetes sp.]
MTFNIILLLGLLPEDIFCFATKLYHLWSILARGVFFMPIFKEE